MNWATMVQEELLKGLKSAQTLISFGPQLTRVIEFALDNPSIYIRVANNQERDLREPPRHRAPRHPRNPRPKPNPQPDPNPILNAIPIGNLGDLGGEFFEANRDHNDLYASELLRAILDNLFLHSEGSHHGGEQPPNLFGHRSGMGQNEPPRGSAMIPMNIEVEREEGWEERTNSNQGSNEMSPSHCVFVVM